MYLASIALRLADFADYTFHVLSFAFAASSISMPRNRRSRQMRSRMAGAFSPMPPANTSVSSPPSAAAKAPIHFLA